MHSRPGVDRQHQYVRLPYVRVSVTRPIFGPLSGRSDGFSKIGGLQWRRERAGSMRPGRCGISRGEKRLKRTCISFERSNYSKCVEKLME